LLFGELKAGDGPICRITRNTNYAKHQEVARTSKSEYQMINFIHQAVDKYNETSTGK